MDDPKDTQGATTSEETKGTSTEPKTFTEEQVTASNQKAVSDALSAAGRTAKALEAQQQSITADKERIAQNLKNSDEAELEANRDDPEKLSAVRERQSRRTAETKLAEKELELKNEQAKNTEAQEAGAVHTKEQNAREVATRLNVDAETLMKYTDGSKEAMEDLAKSLPKKVETKTVTTDSGETIGGKVITEQARLDKLYPTMKKT